jgi:hypothetical protein
MVHAAIAHARPGDVLVLTMPDPFPVALVGDLLATQAREQGVAALLVDGAVRCWGSDAYGQLGDGGANANSGVPSSAVALGQPARALSAGGIFGDAHTCALLADGAVRDPDTASHMADSYLAAQAEYLPRFA